MPCSTFWRYRWVHPIWTDPISLTSPEMCNIFIDSKACTKVGQLKQFSKTNSPIENNSKEIDDNGWTHLRNQNLIYIVKFWRTPNFDSVSQIFEDLHQVFDIKHQNLLFGVNFWCLQSKFSNENDHFNVTSEYLTSAVKNFDNWHQILMPSFKYIIHFVKYLTNSIEIWRLSKFDAPSQIPTS